jgi:hypothetical protein
LPLLALGSSCATHSAYKVSREEAAPAAQEMMGGMAAAPSVDPGTPPTPGGAQRGAILVYTARLNLAVFDVANTQERIITLVQSLGGFSSAQSTATLTVRVPAAKFEEVLKGLEKLGDVLQKDVTADDVTREYQELELRIKNARAVRDRLEALLAKTAKIDETLAVERELARVTQDIESMEGSLRFLKDRVALSTITVNFSSRAKELVKSNFQLPFPWLQELGLGSLLHFSGGE